jgi:serine/threonine protein phosphatase PrpC
MSHARLSLVWRAFAVPKAGNSPDEFEDAFAADPHSGRFAVADGASESAGAGTWARLLVESCVQRPGRWPNWLPSARRRWQELCQGPDLPWYLEQKIAEGAFATLLGVSFRGRARLQAAAGGDSCLFLVRGAGLRRAFPVRRSRDFSNRPVLLSSRTHPAESKVKRWTLSADWQRGDRLLLTTDALAQWFLQQVEDGQQPWDELHGLQTQDQFAAWIQQARAGGQLRNDDVTLLAVDSLPQ